MSALLEAAIEATEAVRNDPGPDAWQSIALVLLDRMLELEAELGYRWCGLCDCRHAPRAHLPSGNE